MKQLKSYFETAEFITKFLEGRLSPEESDKLQGWINENEKHKATWEKLTDPVYLEDHLHDWENPNTAKHWEQLEDVLSDGNRRTSKQIQRKIIFRKTLRYAAIIIPAVVLCGIGWHYLTTGKKKVNPSGSLAGVYIMPKGQVAQLILGNGKVVDLNDSLQETITEKDGTKVKSGAHAVKYFENAGDKGEVVYNTLITPRGGEYEVVLADGTKAWLNAASSLRYPTRFNGQERKVYLSGEGYFEVAKDEKHPFVVNAANTDITVLGTKFDVSSYSDDPSQEVVLAEGSVMVNNFKNQIKENKDVILKPGFAAIIKENHPIYIRQADVEAALGWKNGMFVFDGESLGIIMRKLSRWYNVDVMYDDGVDTLFHFTGRIKRYENITGLLKLIELTGKVKFSIVGNEVVVRPGE